MIHHLRILSVLFVAATVSACSTLGSPSPEPQLPLRDDQIVLLIGLDGLRYDAIDRHDAPNLRALAARGTRPQHMISVMPSKTFVNFYSIATGLYPENHGMVSNSPWDREAEAFFSNRDGDAQNPFWWHGEAIWVAAENQGKRAHVMFWLGSEVEGRRPTVWHPYEHERPYEERVAEVLSWFDAPVEEQPDFAAVYFDHVDSVTHRNGVFTEAEGAAVARVDALVGMLVDGLTARGLLDRTNIMIVSDHGMANVSTERTIAIDTLSDLDGVFIAEHAGRFGAGLDTFISGFGEAEAIDAAYADLLGAHPHLSVYRRGDMPEHFHFDHPTRGPDLLMLADPGWLITRSDSDLSNPYLASLRGNHGYDNRSEEMGATFIGAGPIFPVDHRPAEFENVNVYGLIACALGIEPAQTDGDAGEVERLTGGQCPDQ